MRTGPPLEGAIVRTGQPKFGHQRRNWCLNYRHVGKHDRRLAMDNRARASGVRSSAPHGIIAGDQQPANRPGFGTERQIVKCIVIRVTCEIERPSILMNKRIKGDDHWSEVSNHISSRRVVSQQLEQNCFR